MGASGDAMKFEKLLPLAAVVAGALLLVAAAGGGVLAKTLVANALNKGQYLGVHSAPLCRHSRAQSGRQTVSARSGQEGTQCGH